MIAASLFIVTTSMVPTAIPAEATHKSICIVLFDVEIGGIEQTFVEVAVIPTDRSDIFVAALEDQEAQVTCTPVKHAVVDDDIIDEDDDVIVDDDIVDFEETVDETVNEIDEIVNDDIVDEETVDEETVDEETVDEE
jgi:hypothetical protein